MSKRGLDHIGVMLPNREEDDDKLVKAFADRFGWFVGEKIRLEEHGRNIYWIEADGGLFFEVIALDDPNSRPSYITIDHVAFKGRPPVQAVKSVDEVMSIEELGVDVAFFPMIDGWRSGRIEYVEDRKQQE